MLSVRQIQKVNTGKQTAGIDKEVINTPAQRVKLVNNQHELDHLNGIVFLERLESSQDLYTEQEYQEIIDQHDWTNTSNWRWFGRYGN